MGIHAKPLASSMGVEVIGLDPRNLTDEDKVAVKLLFDNHHLILFRDADVSEDQHLDVVKAVGPISGGDALMKSGRKFTYISNVHTDGRLPDGELFYHSDHMFLREPLKGISLYAIEAPEHGGETRYLNAAAAYQALPAHLKERVQGLSARHVYDYSVNRGDKRPDPSTLSENADTYIHPLVWPHPESGTPLLFLSRLFTTEIIGMEESESDALLDELFDFMDSRGDDYVHKWSPGDLIIWDNLHLQHARNNFPPDERRALRRVPIGLASA